MMFVAAWADEANRRMHNAEVEARKAHHRLARATRALRSSRATVTAERVRTRQAEQILRNLKALAESAEERGLMMSSRFLVMHVDLAIRELGGEP